MVCTALIPSSHSNWITRDGNIKHIGVPWRHQECLSFAAGKSNNILCMQSRVCVTWKFCMEKISTAEIFAAAIMFEQIKRALHVSCELPSRNLYKSHARFLSLRSEMLSPRSLSQAASIIAASAAGRKGGAGQKVANRVGWSLSDYRHVLRSSRLSAQMHFSLPPLASRCGRCIRNALHRKKQWIAAINRLEARENTRRHKIEPHIFFIQLSTQIPPLCSTIECRPFGLIM